MKAGVVQECKRRRWFENKHEKKKRKVREAARRNRKRFAPFSSDFFSFPFDSEMYGIQNGVSTAFYDKRGFGNSMLLGYPSEILGFRNPLGFSLFLLLTVSFLSRWIFIHSKSKLGIGNPDCLGYLDFRKIGEVSGFGDFLDFPFFLFLLRDSAS